MGLKLNMKKYNNFILDKKSNVIFSFVPKVACTNWKSILRYSAGKNNYLDSNLAHDESKNGLCYIKDEALLKNKHCKVITFVRNPYTRILSAYLNKIESRIPRLENIVNDSDFFLKVTNDIEEFRKSKLNNNKYPEISFEVFLFWLIQGKSPYVHDAHFINQSILTNFKNLNYEFVGRFENFIEDSNIY